MKFSNEYDFSRFYENVSMTWPAFIIHDQGAFIDDNAFIKFYRNLNG